MTLALAIAAAVLAAVGISNVFRYHGPLTTREWDAITHDHTMAWLDRIEKEL